MATAIAARPSSAAPARRRTGPSPQLAKLKDRAKNAAKRTRDLASEESDALSMAGTGLVLGLMQRNKVKIPTIWGIDPQLLVGGGAYLLTRKSRSGMGRVAKMAAMTSVAIGIKDATVRGSIKVSGDGDDGDGDDDDDL